MRKTIFVVILLIILAVAGGVLAYFKDAPVFDAFFPAEAREERKLNRLAGLFSENIGDYSLYSRSPEKVQKRKLNCEQINETLNREDGNIEIRGTVCGRFVIGQYRQAGTDKVVIVHLYEATEGKEILKKLFTNMAERLGEYDVSRPEQHEIVWLSDSKIDYVVTQEGRIKIEQGGGESISYGEKATGNNAVTQYYISEFLPINLGKN